MFTTQHLCSCFWFYNGSYVYVECIVYLFPSVGMHVLSSFVCTRWYAVCRFSIYKCGVIYCLDNLDITALIIHIR